MLKKISYMVGMLCEYFMNSSITTRKKYNTIIFSIFPVWLGLRLISMLCIFSTIVPRTGDWLRCFC